MAATPGAAIPSKIAAANAGLVARVRAATRRGRSQGVVDLVIFGPFSGLLPIYLFERQSFRPYLLWRTISHNRPAQRSVGTSLPLPS